MPKIKTIPLLEIVFKNSGGTSDIWKAISELLHNKEDEISVFCPYIKNKINSYNKETSILALTLLDFCVDDGRMPLWSALNTKNFLSSLVNSLKTREETDIQNMILYLIQKWGKKFKGNDELSNFEIVYNKLKNNNITFPTETNHPYTKYVNLKKTSSYNQYSSSNKNNDNYFNRNNRNSNQIMVETDPEDYLKDINVNLNTSSYDKIYKRLVNKLYDWTHAIHEVNILINQNNNGNNNSKIEGLFKDLTKGNRQLVETIQSGKLKDKTLMDISLNVVDDINMSLGRWNNYKNGREPGPFVSSFFQNDEWRNKKFNNANNNNSNSNSNYNNINNFYNINNSTFNNNINNSNNFNNNINNNNNYNNINNNAMNQFNNNNNYMENPELKNYPKLYEKLKNTNNNNYQINNNYPNFESQNNSINNSQNINNNNFDKNNNNNNNQGSFNLLIDFDTAPVASSSNNRNEPNLNLNDKNNMDKFVDFITMTEKQNQINNKMNNDMNNNINMMKNMNINDNNFKNKNMNNNVLYNYENRDMENPYNDRKFSNDYINTSQINKSAVYPTFEELEESNINNNNNNINQNKIKKEEVDILSKFDF